MQLQLRYTNYTTPQLQLHYTTTTTTAALHHTTSSSCGWGDRLGDHCKHCNHPGEEKTAPTTFRSISGLWFTATNLSYRFPIFETSAAALCGTTGMDWHWLIWIDKDWYGVTWVDMDWYGVIWSEMGWHGLIWIDTECFGVKWVDMCWYGLIRSDMEWNGLRWIDIEWYGVKWLDMVI